MACGKVLSQRKVGPCHSWIRPRTSSRRTPTRFEQAIDKAGDFVDDKTSGKFQDAVDKVQDAAKSAAGQGRRWAKRTRTLRPMRPQGHRRQVIRPPLKLAKLSVSVDVPLPPEKAWQCASDLSRFKEWLTIHRVWRSKLPETLDKGTTIESIVEVKGMPNRVKWTIVHYKPPQAMTLNGDGRGGVKIKLIAKITPKGDNSIVTFDVHLGGPALFGPIGMVVAAALKGDIRRLSEQVRHRCSPRPPESSDREQTQNPTFAAGFTRLCVCSRESGQGTHGNGADHTSRVPPDGPVLTSSRPPHSRARRPRFARPLRVMPAGNPDPSSVTVIDEIVVHLEVHRHR